MASASELQQRALKCAKSGDFGARALEINRELTEVEPSNQGAWTRLARCYLESGLLDDATGALETALRLNPQNTIARNLHGEVTRRRVVSVASAKPKPGARPTAAGSTGGGFGRPEFTALGQLPPAVAVEALGSKIEALLMALNERPFAAKAVDTRNRAGRSGGRLYRRNSFYPGADGHVFAFHHGGRWEPQLNIGLFAAPQWGRDCLRAGIGFNLTQDGADPAREAGRERVLASFAQFQQLVSSAWRNLLADWMAAHSGFIQYGAGGPATDRLPKDALGAIVNCQNPAAVGWVFLGRWLFADRPADAATLADQRRLVAWIDEAFTALLPVWASLLRP